MITEGVATKADGLSVKVKVNEAEMKLTQIDNGLSLSKMVLCQLCGLPLNDEIRLADEDVESLTLLEYHVGDNVATALANREELRSLDLANKIYDQKSISPRGISSYSGSDRQLHGNQSLIGKRL